MPGFEIKKDKTKWIVAGTGNGWEHLPRQTEKTVMCLNDYIRMERYGVKPDYLCMMDVLDEKPQVVSGQDNLGEVIQRINAMRIPFIAPYKYAEIPMSEAFPLEECVKEFGMPYMTNTIAYMIFYALLKGAKEIELYGVNQAGSHEYTVERGGVEYALGIAVGRGIKVTINGAHSQLLGNNPRAGGMILYGYNATYAQIQRDKERFGEGIVKRLLVPPKPVSRTIRQVN